MTSHLFYAQFGVEDIIHFDGISVIGNLLFLYPTSMKLHRCMIILQTVLYCVAMNFIYGYSVLYQQIGLKWTPLAKV